MSFGSSDAVVGGDAVGTTVGAALIGDGLRADAAALGRGEPFALWDAPAWQPTTTRARAAIARREGRNELIEILLQR